VPLALTALLIGTAFGLLNTIVRPLLLLVTERIVVRTVGLFLLVNQSEFQLTRSGTRACSPALKISSTNFGKSIDVDRERKRDDTSRPFRIDGAIRCSAR
jgi:uncharacterized membrane protein YvlD (DUF360 family)